MNVTPTHHIAGCTFVAIAKLDATCPRCQAITILGQRAAKKRAGKR